MTLEELQQYMRDKLRKAYNFGQTYWQQADSEYRSQHKKADETAAKFAELVEDVVLAVTFEMNRAAQQAPDRGTINTGAVRFTYVGECWTLTTQDDVLLANGAAERFFAYPQQPAKEAASGTDAGQAKKSDFDIFLDEAKRTNLTADDLVAALKDRPEFADCRPAQARPDGGLPAFQQDEEYRLFMAANRQQSIEKAEGREISEYMVDWHGDRHWNGKPGEMWRARAALAASQQAAEPAAYHTQDRKMLAFAEFIKPECRADMVPLYRAAPPQQAPIQDMPPPVLTVEIFRRGRVERHQPNQNYYTEEQMRAALAQKGGA